MAFLPVNVVLVFFFALFYLWGWEGQLLRNMVTVISAVFMLPMWITPLYLMTESGNTVVLQAIPNWLPTNIYGTIVLFTVVLMYWGVAHAFEEVERDMIGRDKATKKYRRKR